VDIGSLIGFIVGILAALVMMLMPLGWNFGDMVTAFVMVDGILFTFGGAFAGTLIANPLPRVLQALKAASKVFMPPKIDLTNAIGKIINLSNLARKEGLLALEEAANSMDDPFLQKGVMLVVDGAEAELVRNILETEMSYIENRHTSVRGVWEFLGNAGPAWGMIGTLIGLVLMLGDMSDPNALGPKMAVTLLTTFYGSILANLVALPIAAKLKVYSAEEMLLKEVLIEGILSIQAGENPRIIEEKLKAFLSPVLRKTASTGEAKAGEE